MVRTRHFRCRGRGSTAGRGAEIPYVFLAQPKQKYSFRQVILTTTCVIILRKGVGHSRKGFNYPDLSLNPKSDITTSSGETSLKKKWVIRSNESMQQLEFPMLQRYLIFAILS